MTGTDQRRGAPDDGRRMTKAERREEARLKREEIQRKMATRKRNRRMGLVFVVVAVVIAVIAVFMTSGGDETSASGIPSAETLLAQADAAAGTAGWPPCSPAPQAAASKPAAAPCARTVRLAIMYLPLLRFMT